jgi:hypothetical protein
VLPIQQRHWPCTPTVRELAAEHELLLIFERHASAVNRVGRATMSAAGTAMQHHSSKAHKQAKHRYTLTCSALLPANLVLQMSHDRACACGLFDIAAGARKEQLQYAAHVMNKMYDHKYT